MPRRLAGALVALFAGCAVAAAEDNPWPERTAVDLQFMHDTLAADHPGPAIDPAFAARLDSALAEGLAAARSADSVTAYIYLLMAYANALPDNHLEIWGARDNPEWASVPRPPTLYPGFITAWRNGAYRVRAAADAGEVRDGMAVVSCDGRTADALAAANIFRFQGRAEQPADPMRFAPLLFVDQGQPGFVRPERCSFDDAGRTVTAALRWRETSFREIGQAYADATFGTPPPFGATRLGDGGLWIALPTFVAGQIAAEDAAAVQAMLRDGRDAPYVVFDLRGNGGGSSFFADGFAMALFGEDYVRTWQRIESGGRAPDLVRASPGNRAYFAGAGTDDDPGARAYFEILVAAIDAALAAGEPVAALGGPTPEAGIDMPPAPYAGQVFLLTDGAAFSSTLLFIDTVLGYPDAVLVGWPTRAHGLYGELRQVRLPSGWASLAFSTKAFMGRGVEADLAIVPQIPWDGEIGDTPALQAWIHGLAEGR
ncbi:MAG: S41 family peptidase [Alphaproteobacteria bacterium]